ncbi:MAG: extracellular solute-binding protein [Firmicutes bacterium]|nr:extracellular solute-binding protein [Bacillota bacterium]
MKKLVALLLAMILAVSAFGCAGQGGEESKSGGNAGTASDFTYPVPANSDGTKVTVSMNKDDFVRADLPAYTQIDGKSYYYFDALEEATGIHVNFIGSGSNPQATTEAVNLLIVSGEYPDVWRVNWITHPGGPTGALEDGLILNLSENAEYVPNLVAFYDADPDLKKLVVNDDGDYFCFPYMVDIEEEGNVGLGAHFRTDWLADLGLELPETVDEWTEALRAFKGMGKGGLTFEARWLWLEHSAANLSNAFNTVYGFYHTDGVVTYGPLDEGYGDFVELLASWYAEGLLDPDFATVDKSTVKAKWANHEYGAVLLHTGDGENGINANKDTDTPLECDTVPPMVMNKGDKAEFGHFNAKFNGGFSHSVSPGDNQEMAMRWCDYLYSDAGRKLTSLGTEGITWIADENGNWKEFTDLVMNNDTTTDSPSNILYQFACKTNWGYPQMKEVYSYFNSEYVNKGNADYANTNMSAHYYPTVTHTAEEAEIISNTFSDIETFVKEGVMKFILGTTPMSEWDSFVAQIKSLGIDEVIEAKQAAYDRFKAR